MAGVPAGRLSIEVVAEVARLQQDMDKIKRAVKAASGEIANDTTKINNSFDRTAKRVNANVGGMRMGMLQMSYQLGDVAQGFAMGTNPMTIFIQQSGQVTQALSLMAGSAKGVLGFLGGPWGIALAAATSLLVPFIAKLFDTSDALKGVRKDAQDAISSLRELGNVSTTASKVAMAVSELSRLQQEEAAILSKMAQQRTTVSDPRATFQVDVLRSARRSSEEELFRVRQKILEAQDAIAKGNSNIAEEDSKNVEGMIADRAKLLGATTALDKAQAEYAISIRQADRAYERSGKTEADRARLLERRAAAELKLNQAQDANRGASSGRSEQRRLDTLAREAEATEVLIAGLYKVADAYMASGQAAMKAEAEAKAMEQAIKKRADVEAYVARQVRLAIAQRTVEAAKSVDALRDENDIRTILNEQIAQGIITNEQATTVMKNEADLRPFIIAQVSAEGAAKEKLTQIIAELRKEQARSNEEAIRAEELKLLESNKSKISLMEREIELSERLGKARLEAVQGLSGSSLRDELARVNLEHQKSEIYLKAQAEAAEYVKRGMNEMAEATLRAADAQAKLLDVANTYTIAIDRWEERWGNLRDFISEVNKTPEEMQMAFEGIKMRGLDALNDALVEAIMNFDNLGDIAANVVKQILAELLRLQIQQSIIGPLAKALGLVVGAVGSGGPVNLLAGTPYDGARATGGPVSANRSYLVGEDGPEVLTMGSVSGYITPNDRIQDMQGAAANDVGSGNTFIWHVKANDADSFKKSQRQIENEARRRLGTS